MEENIIDFYGDRISPSDVQRMLITVSYVKAGDKFDVINKSIVGGFLEKTYRSLSSIKKFFGYSDQDRYDLYNFLNELCYSSILVMKKLPGIKDDMTTILQKFREGVSNIRITYISDTKFISYIDVLLKKIDKIIVGDTEYY